MVLKNLHRHPVLTLAYACQRGPRRLKCGLRPNILPRLLRRWDIGHSSYTMDAETRWVESRLDNRPGNLDPDAMTSDGPSQDEEVLG